MTVHSLAVVIVEVEDLDRATAFYRDLLGLDLHLGDNQIGQDRWISGLHAEISWREGRYLHFALYKSKGVVTRDVQLGFYVEHLEALHERLVAAGTPVDHPPRPEPWGRTARYRDPDGNSVSLTERGRS